jgi:hypothetical protein
MPAREGHSTGMVEANSTSLVKFLVFWVGLETVISTYNVKCNVHFVKLYQYIRMILVAVLKNYMIGRAIKVDRGRIFRFEQSKA